MYDCNNTNGVEVDVDDDYDYTKKLTTLLIYSRMCI